MKSKSSSANVPENVSFKTGLMASLSLALMVTALFLSATGSCHGMSFEYSGSYGDYWFATLLESDDFGSPMSSFSRYYHPCFLYKCCFFCFFRDR